MPLCQLSDNDKVPPQTCQLSNSEEVYKILLYGRFEEYEEIELCHYDWTEKGTDAPCKSEICKSFAYDTQTFILNWDGSMYNEICEFTFDDEKTGHGYYCQANRDAAE